MAEKNSKVNIKKVALFILYGLITVLFLFFILSMGDIDEIFITLGKADFRYVLCALAMVLLYVLTYPISLVILTRASGCDIRRRDTYRVAMLEHFFNGITPFATGGQPFQVYAFKRHGVGLSSSTSLLLMNFMVHMMVTNCFALLSLIFVNRFVTTTSMAVLAIIGFTLNFLVFVMTFLLATSKRLRALLCKLLDGLCRIKWISKFLSPKVDNIKGYFVQVQDAFSALIRKKKSFFMAIAARVVSMVAYYITTFFVLRALYVDVPWSELFFVISGSSFAITMVVFLPTPGSSGGIEFAFKSVLVGIAVGAAASVAYSGMLMWRLLTYYLVMLISLGFYIAFEFRVRHKPHKFAPDNDSEEAQTE